MRMFTEKEVVVELISEAVNIPADMISLTEEGLWDSVDTMAILGFMAREEMVVSPLDVGLLKTAGGIVELVRRFGRLVE